MLIDTKPTDQEKLVTLMKKLCVEVIEKKTYVQAGDRRFHFDPHGRLAQVHEFKDGKWIMTASAPADHKPKEAQA